MAVCVVSIWKVAEKTFPFSREKLMLSVSIVTLSAVKDVDRMVKSVVPISDRPVTDPDVPI